MADAMQRADQQPGAVDSASEDVRLRTEKERLLAERARLLADRERMKAKKERLLAERDRLLAKEAALRRRLAESEPQVGSNNSNSGKPLSSVGPRKPPRRRRQSRRGRSGKRPSGQPGH